MGESDHLQQRHRAAYYVDEQGRRTEDPALAVRGEIVDVDPATGRSRRVWFFASRADLSWLPIRESAFLLWVLVALLGVWLALGVALGLI